MRFTSRIFSKLRGGQFPRDRIARCAGQRYQPVERAEGVADSPVQLGRLGFVSEVGTKQPFLRIEAVAREHFGYGIRPGAVLANDISPTCLNQERGKHFADAATGAGDQH